ncbi:MAG: DUF881 domain-containing protein [Actinobacteria bacterium]|nr:DUF881 domain-containing protein [Actinomycetota bacterium]
MDSVEQPRSGRPGSPQPVLTGRRRWGYGLAALCFGFVAVTAGFSTDASRRANQPRREQLVELISSRESQIAKMEQDLAELRADLQREVEAASRETASERATAEASRVLAIQAGATAVTGPGLEVVMSDSERVPGPNEDPSLYRVHDVDIQLVVNALFSLGAEALAVDSQRVVSTTAIRGAGETILVNFRPLVPPYVVSAIGVSARTFERHPVARRLARWEDLFGLGFRLRDSEEVTVPAYAGQVGLRHAEPGRPTASTPAGRG